MPSAQSECHAESEGATEESDENLHNRLSVLSDGMSESADNEVLGSHTVAVGTESSDEHP